MFKPIIKICFSKNKTNTSKKRPFPEQRTLYTLLAFYLFKTYTVSKETFSARQIIIKFGIMKC